MAGVCFDKLQVGQVFRHLPSRIVTGMDDVPFSSMTHDPALPHPDEDHCRTRTEFGQRLVNAAFTPGPMVGILVGDTTLGVAVANFGRDEARFPKPLIHGDTVRVGTGVLDLRPSRSRSHAGIVTFLHRACNRRGDLVASCKRSGLQPKRPAEKTA